MKLFKLKKESFILLTTNFCFLWHTQYHFIIALTIDVLLKPGALFWNWKDNKCWETSVDKKNCNLVGQICSLLFVWHLMKVSIKDSRGSKISSEDNPKMYVLLQMSK